MSAAVKINGIGKFDLNPRGNLWMKDDKKFGLKLLTKMGWSQGKGLGKNEDGILENVKVRMKKSNTGVGWTEKLPMGIEKDEYDAILQNLSKTFNTHEEVDAKSNLPSLEHRSQQFKNRIHYQKFVRGKDVCQYSQKDMDSIFIMKKSKDEPVTIKSVLTNTDICPEEEKQDSVPMYKSQLNIKDYFESKLKHKLGCTMKTNCSAEVPTSIEESCPVANGVPTKKRKKELKNTEMLKRIKIEPGILNEVGVDLLHKEEFKEEVDNGSEQCATEVSTSSKKQKIKSKDSKKHKSSKLQGFKSCLKSKSKYTFKKEPKEVSFNELVSYKIIDSDLEERDEISGVEGTDEQNVLNNFQSNECADEEKELTLENPLNHVDANNEECTLHEGQNSAFYPNNVAENRILEESGNVEDEDLEVDPCFDLPTTGNSNFNLWMESQRQATKMKLYKTMFKKIKKHSILRTSNLLSIKGYGNWGL